MTLSPDKKLAFAYLPARHRAAVEALFAIDAAMGEVVRTSSQPMLGAIRLAWWREAVQRLDHHPPPPEPRLQAAASELLQRGITGGMLAELEDGWSTLLDEEPDIERVAVRGQKLFEMGARLLGATDDLTSIAGRLYGYESVFRRGLFPRHWPTEEMHQLLRHRFPRRLRPLTALARLAARDSRQSPRIEPEATPGRAAALIVHRLTGWVA